MNELKQLEKIFFKGQISRREFLSRTAAMGFTMAASPLLFSGVTRAATPRKGGTLRVGIQEGETSDSIHPAEGLSNSMAFLSCTLRNFLIEIDASGEVIPELAESWDVSKDAKTWTFKLRKGVEFHNGKTFDVEDVLFSINLHRVEGTKSGAKALVDTIEDIKVLDKYTIQFILKSGQMDFPVYLAFYYLCMVPKDTTDFTIGTGGYILEKWEPGVISIFKRNPNYWKAGRAHFDRVEMKTIKDDTARTSALRTGVIDVMNKCDFRTLDHLKRVKDIQVIQNTGRRHFVMNMLTDVAPYDNNDVRLALKYAIDREHVLNTILNGYGTVGNDHPISKAYRFFDKDLPQRTYDPEKAKYHLKKAGMEGHVFKLHTSDTAHKGAVDTAQLFQQHAAKAGIKIQVVKEAADGYWSEVWNKKGFSQSYWSGKATIDLMLTLSYKGGAAWNDTHFNHARFDQLLEAARSEQDYQKRREMYGEMQRILKDEGGVITPVFADLVEAATTRIKFGDKYGTDLDLDSGRFAERWWFES